VEVGVTAVGAGTDAEAGLAAGETAEDAGTLDEGGTGASRAPDGALAGSVMADAEVASAKAALFRVNNVRQAAEQADAIFRPFLREPPRVFMLHNPFFVA
jgi:hypothetical protein